MLKYKNICLTEENKDKEPKLSKNIPVICIAVNDISFFEHLVGENGIAVMLALYKSQLSCIVGLIDKSIPKFEEDNIKNINEKIDNYDIINHKLN